MTTTLTRTRGLPTTKLPTVVDLYCRISQDYDGTTRSVDSQEEDLLDAVEDRAGDWVVGEVFKDHAKSAWNPKVIRADFERMMARLETGKSQGVMVYDLTRFTRKPIEGERLLALAARGVVVASLTTDYNLRTADGRKQFRDAMTAAAHESDKISERVRRGKKKKARRGMSNATRRGFARPGYLPNPEGWEPGMMRTPVPAEQLKGEQDEVREMARKLLTGTPMEAICRDLNTREVYTVNGSEWTSVSLRQVLEAPSIAGLVEYQGEVMEGKELTDGGALDKETWDALQDVLSARRRGRPATKYLLAGIARCGKCDAPLYGRPRRNMKPYPVDPANPDADTTRREYWCQKQAGKDGCGRLAIDQRFADEMVSAAVLERLGNPNHQAALRKRAEKVDAVRDELRAQINQQKETKLGILSKATEYGADGVDAAVQPVLARIKKLETQLDALDGGPDAGEVHDDVAADWAAGSVVQRRRMIQQAFPSGIVIRPATARGRAAMRADRFDWDPVAR